MVAITKATKRRVSPPLSSYLLKQHKKAFTPKIATALLKNGKIKIKGTPAAVCVVDFHHLVIAHAGRTEKSGLAAALV